KDVPGMLGVETGALIPAEPGPTMNAAIVDLPGPAAIERIVGRWFSTSPEVLGVALIIGLFVTLRRREWGIGHTLFAVTAACMVVVLYRLLDAVGDPGYLSRRHVFTLVALGLPLAARGLLGIAALLRPHLPAGMGRRAAALVVALVLAVLAPKAIAAHRSDQRAQRDAACHILEHGGVGQMVFTTREKVGYYAGGSIVRFCSSADAVLAQLFACERAWLAFYRERVDRHTPGFTTRLQGAPAGLERVGSFLEEHAAPSRHLDLYLWQRPEAGSR
ncbi:MAG: hypothetical protein ACE5GW_08870, partial [Planctomycetota bacterium]